MPDPSTSPADIERAAELLAQAAGATIAFTGAGMSAESGISTFRGKGGVHDKYPPSTFGTASGLAGAYLFQFQRLRGFLRDTSRVFLDARPNDGHRALAELERRGLLRAVVTQNVDGLHQDAGNTDVVELHGSYFDGRCTACKRIEAVGRPAVGSFMERLEAEGTGRLSFVQAYRRHGNRCPHCGRLLRPATVLFGEGLPEDAYDRAVALAEHCRALVVIGTTMEVRPASDIPFIALQQGASIVEINPEPTHITPMATVSLQGPSGELLPRLLSCSST